MCQPKELGGKRCEAATKRYNRRRKIQRNQDRATQSFETTGKRSIALIAPQQFFDEAIASGEILASKSKEFPELTVYNYSQDSHYAQNWNDITNSCRGLIVNTETGEIVARPFTKFFNNGDPNKYNDFPRTGRIDVMDKQDGSMGTLYQKPDGSMGMATRGSMNSEQAKHAEKVYNERYQGKWEPSPNHTYVYEIIYPENRVVLNYGDTDDVVMLGAIDKTTGKSIAWDEINKAGWPGPVVERYSYESFDDVVNDSKVGMNNKEGFVVHFLDHDKRVKLKFDEYLALHRNMFSMSPKRVWETLKEGKDVKEWAAEVPDEFYDDIDKAATTMKSRYADYDKSARQLHADIMAKAPKGYTQGELIQTIRDHAKTKHEHFNVGDMIALVTAKQKGMDDTVYPKMFWKRLEPRGTGF